MQQKPIVVMEKNSSCSVSQTKTFPLLSEKVWQRRKIYEPIYPTNLDS